MGQKENPWGPQVLVYFPFANRVFEVPFLTHNLGRVEMAVKEGTSIVLVWEKWALGAYFLCRLELLCC